MTTLKQRRKVLVCDDNPKRVADWAARLTSILDETAFEVSPLSPGGFAEAVGALHERLRASKAQQGLSLDDGAHVLDAADILLIDSDLTPDPSVEVDSTSERAIDENLVGEYGSNVARLARAYSTAGVLVVINHIYKQRTFDLTMTRFSELPADAYITSNDLDNRSLWEGGIDGSFRPWAWPNLARLLPPDRSTLASATLDSNVLEALGLDEARAELIDDRQWERLSFDVGSPSSATLRQVALSTSFGIGPIANASAPDEQLLRIAKSALRRWLDHVISPSQNLIVDLPHLVQDRPWLAPDSRKDRDKLAQLVAGSWDDHQRIAPEAYATELSQFIGRSVWWVDQLPGRQSGDRLDSDDFVFCEDTSDFRHPEETREFESNIPGSFQSRFVAKLPGIEYTPIRRLLI